MSIQYFFGNSSPAMRFKASARSSPSRFPLLSGLETQACTPHKEV
ncbi:hypothetical protein ACFOWA_16730 [Pedobacter lithocola]|uniref:Uncharacterized protein n=1 Tax=Pedobacter lithocola TaxID=1908239 RepID=A0ABV8PCC2_9SPHI